MNAPNAIIRTTVASVAAVPRIRPNPGRHRKPSPLPLRPLVPDRFKPPKGEKKVFLPNFTLTFLRTPTQPPHFASFLTPLWLNKLDLKDYLYHLYNIQVLRVRSFIIQGKVTRNPRTRRVRRISPSKKMTVELVQGVEGQGPFVWPEEPKDLKPWSGQDREDVDKLLREQRRRRDMEVRGEMAGPKEDAEGLRKRAKGLLAGRVRWRPSWEVSGGGKAMGRERDGDEQLWEKGGWAVEEEEEEEK